MTLQELREALKAKQTELQKLGKTVEERRTAGKSGSELWSGDEQKTFDTLTGDIATLNESIDAEERAEALQAHLARANEQRNQQTRNGRLDPRQSDTIPGSEMEYGERFSTRDESRAHATFEQRCERVFHAWAASELCPQVITDEHRSAMAALKVTNFGKSIDFLGHDNSTAQELRANLSQRVGIDALTSAKTLLEKRAIGYAANYQSWVPTAFRDSFEIAFHGNGGVMSLCDMLITDGAEQLPWPFADDSANEGQQVVEATPLDGAGVDALMSVPSLGAYDFSSKIAQIATTLLENSPFDLATMLGQILGERINKAIERLLINGNRTNTIGGILNRGVQGTTTPFATPVSVTKLRELIWSVIGEHRDRGTLVLHDQTLAAFASLTDTTNQPLLNIGNGRIQYAKDVSVPYRVSNYMKASNSTSPALAAGDKIIAFGDFRQMKVRVVRRVRLKRLEELFALSHMTGFVANRSADADLLRSSNTANCPIKFQASV